MAIRGSDSPAKKRMDEYLAACIIWWVMIETPGMFAITGYLLTDNLSFFFLGVLHILVLFVFMRRKDNIIALLQLNSREVSQLEERE